MQIHKPDYLRHSAIHLLADLEQLEMMVSPGMIKKLDK